jgi:hypothetical protein
MTAKSLAKFLLVPGLIVALSGCFRPVIPFQTQPRYPVEIFYENQRPDRPYEEITKLEVHRETSLNPATANQGGRMVGRGNNMEAKELLLAQLTLDAKRLGADALINIKYSYFTAVNTNGYAMEGVAVRWREEKSVN